MKPQEEKVYEEDSQVSYSPQFLDKQTADLIRWNLDSSLEIGQLILKLRGWVYMGVNKKTGMDEYQLKEPFMNDNGIQRIASILENIESKSTYLSNFNDTETYKLIRHTLFDILEVIFVEGDNFEIKNTMDKNIIMNMATLAVFRALKRPFQEGERKFIRMGPAKETRIIAGEKGRGLFGK